MLIGIEDSDTQAVADKMISKMLGLRIFEDEEGKMNLALKDVGGGLLLISQFTLCGLQKGKPSILCQGRQTGYGRTDV